MSDAAEHDRILADLAAGLDDVDALDPAAREVVYGVLDAVDRLHRRALRRAGEALDEPTLARLRAADRGIAWLLDAYGVGIDQHAVVAAVLDDVAAGAEPAATRIELLDVTDGVVRVRVAGGRHEAVRARLEEALGERLAGFAGLDIAGEESPPPLPDGARLLPLASRPPGG